MLNLPGGLTVWLAKEPQDMRRSFDGLSAVITQHLQQDPLSGHLFVFRNKAADKVKIIYWDRNGLAQWYKRLETGRFRWPRLQQRCCKMTPAELNLLLEGIDLLDKQRLKPL